MLTPNNRITESRPKYVFNYVRYFNMMSCRRHICTSILVFSNINRCMISARRQSH